MAAVAPRHCTFRSQRSVPLYCNLTFMGISVYFACTLSNERLSFLVEFFQIQNEGMMVAVLEFSQEEYLSFELYK